MASDQGNGLSVMLTCRDVRGSVGFYRDRLGFALRESWPDPSEPRWASLVLGGQSIMLGAAVDPERVAEICGGDAAAEAHWTRTARAFQENASGVGVTIYVRVPDVDAYAREIRARGVAFEGEPKDEFYGIRDFRVEDPDGYQLTFFQDIVLTSCQSCGMPLADAQPGEMYCSFCVDEQGHLLPYERVYEGTVAGYFMAAKRMPRAEAEVAAREHLARMPAWSSR